MDNIPNESENYNINKNNIDYIVTFTYTPSTIEIKISQKYHFRDIHIKRRILLMI